MSQGDYPMGPRFGPGQVVGLQADPSRRGPVIEVLARAGGRPRYRVFHSPSDLRDYDEEQLVAVDIPGAVDFAQAILDGHGQDPDTFRARLAAARLSHPLTDNLYALYSARIQSIPFQFKPLLRFLRADQPRLLIADEVGVGKTIEAGLILKEIQARQPLENVMVLCPKALVAKWRTEMRRFEEDFHILTAESLRYCLREAHLDGVWPSQYARAIAPLELLRMEGYLEATATRPPRPTLLTLDPPPMFSLLIVDEAHHLRNPETNSHALGRFLCDVSEAVLFLSATPVHVGSQNLYVLLNLLRPDLFPDERVFAEVLEPSPQIAQAMRCVRHRQPEVGWQQEAAARLDAAGRTSWGSRVLLQDLRFVEWRGRLDQGASLSDVERVRCLRDLEDVHPLAHLMNRTRRRDIGRFTIREPHTVVVPFTEEQEEFYSALIDFRQEMLLERYDPRVIRLITDMLERQAASCLPALVPMLDTFLRTGRFFVAELSDDPEAEEVIGELPPQLRARAARLRLLAARLPPNDPKLDALKGVIDGTLDARGPRKILVFSFFLHTLGYLHHRLSEGGLRVALVTGKVPDEERETLRDRFRLPYEHPAALDVLLSSEVGCEGLDYEFCDRLVNYDIPWNPMRIEQRIGRIDRFGQASEKVLIFNFITPGTVEERIFFRCFERLDVFRDTVGDLEEVLGDVVQDLTRVALDPTLTPAQAEEKARQVADNALRLVEEDRRLEAASGALLGLDQAFTEEVDRLLAEGRFVTPEDLRHMVAMFVGGPGLRGGLSLEERRPGLHRLRLSREARAKLLEQVRALRHPDRSAVAFARWLSGDEPSLMVTFDQAIAVEQRDTPFITPAHPLARLAIEHWEGADGPLVGSLVASDVSCPRGRYLFACELWETIGARSELRLVGVAWDLLSKRLMPDDRVPVVRLLGQARGSPNAGPLTHDAMREGMEQIDAAGYQGRIDALRRLQEANDKLLAQRLASLDAYYQNRLTRVAAELERASDTRIVRMKQAEAERIRRDYRRRREEMEGRRTADIITRRIAAGILEVTRGE